MKKLCAILLAGLMLAGLSLSAFASTPKKIASLHEAFASRLETVELDGEWLPVSALRTLEVRAGSELRVYLTDSGGAPLFFDQTGLPVSAAEATLSRLGAAQMTAEISDTASGVVEGAELGYQNGAPYIAVRFAKALSGLEDTGFSFSLCLGMAGGLQEQTRLPVSGVLRVTTREIFAGEKTVDLRDGAAAAAMADLPEVELVAADGIGITTALSAGERCHVGAELIYDRSEMQGLPVETIGGRDVEKIYRLRGINIDPARSTVRIYSETLLRVCNSQGEYLGTTRDRLPFLEEYYLTVL